MVWMHRVSARQTRTERLERTCAVGVDLTHYVNGLPRPAHFQLYAKQRRLLPAYKHFGSLPLPVYEYERRNLDEVR